MTASESELFQTAFEPTENVAAPLDHAENVLQGTASVAGASTSVAKGATFASV
jgi:hypothetical protein